MGWQNLLQAESEQLVFPWVGGRSIRTKDRTWTIEGDLPPEFEWYTFSLEGRKAKWINPHLLTENQLDSLYVGVNAEVLVYPVCGYLVGDRIILDNVRVDSDPKKIVSFSERVYLVEDGLDRFVRIKAARTFENGPLIFCEQDFPLGAESAVLSAYFDHATSLDSVRGVSPSLDAAFRMEIWKRDEADKKRLILAQLRKEEEERLAKETRRRELVEKLGDGENRRKMAIIDFGEAAKAALAVGGALYLDHRQSRQRGEMIVQFRLLNRRFECVCDTKTLQIIEAGICLTGTDGEKGDSLFSLESLPSVIKEAHDTGVLHIFRHVDD